MAFPDPVTGYGLVAPTEEDVMWHLGRSLGAEAADLAWQAARRRLGVPLWHLLDLDQLETALRIVVDEGGELGRVTATGLLLRIRTYRMLSLTRERPRLAALAA